jgi:2-polyprenyl-3-methyl-5-hydroxy-6-metoxy-1,4-benzoquinol methylase
MSEHLAQREYWERAGQDGYLGTYFVCDEVRKIMSRLWNTAVDIGMGIGIPKNGRVLDLGCGDGTFSNTVLSQNFGSVLGVDFSRTGIERARNNVAGKSVSFEVVDLVSDSVERLGDFDGVFLIGILHHVKPHAEKVLRAVREITPRIVVMEPNGAHLARKILEMTPSYKAAGEDSFRHVQLDELFRKTGFTPRIHERQNIFPNFTPGWAMKLFEPFQPLIESTPVLRGLCTNNLYGCT